MKTKKYTVAITGTFDVENYGDLMFPVIFKAAMKKRGLDINLIMLSPSPTNQKPLNDKDHEETVYSYQEIEKIHQRTPLDALVVGGGAILHFDSFPLWLPGAKDASEYRNSDSWVLPIIFAATHGIKILFNAPQAPFEFPEWSKKIARNIFNTADYLSVRDEISKKHIATIYSPESIPEITVCPDTICSIADYFPKADLSNRRERLLPYEKYAVVHISKTMPKEAIDSLSSVVTTLKRADLRVVLLPLGYTHGDDIFMKEVNRKYQLGCHIFEKKLSIMDMTAILAYSNIYVGTSFHGSVVSIAYGHKSVGYNYFEPTIKSKELYKMYGIEDRLANNYHEIIPVLKNTLQNEWQPKHKAEVISRIEDHFDYIARQIVDSSKSIKKPARSVATEITDYMDLFLDAVNLEARKNIELGVELERAKAKLNSEIEQTKHELSAAKQHWAEAQKNYAEIKKSYDDVLASKSWKITAPIRAVSKKLPGKKA